VAKVLLGWVTAHYVKFKFLSSPESDLDFESDMESCFGAMIRRYFPHEFLRFRTIPLFCKKERTRTSLLSSIWRFMLLEMVTGALGLYVSSMLRMRGRNGCKKDHHEVGWLYFFVSSCCQFVPPPTPPPSSRCHKGRRTSDGLRLWQEKTNYYGSANDREEVPSQSVITTTPQTLSPADRLRLR